MMPAPKQTAKSRKIPSNLSTAPIRSIASEKGVLASSWISMGSSGFVEALL
nr:MAG TPA: hypothetical protein [Caudoviricetes sp.]DAN99539.1 MAG TPA: hypothetical protein [Caudoviricetes sp.]